MLGSVQASDAELRAAIQRQEALVDALAADVAAARIANATRQELSTRMSRYRTEAERLAMMEAPMLQQAADVEHEAHVNATHRLTDALANDRSDDASRAVLVHWLGEPATRIALLESVAAQAGATADPLVRQALALDIAEQAGVLALVCHYDTAKARRDVDRALAQAAAFRARTAPGQSGGLELVVAAERAEQEATEAIARANVANGLAIRLEAIRSDALTHSEGTP